MIPSSAVVANDGDFFCCESLRKIKILSSNQAFIGCSSLLGITIPSSLTKIENKAFEKMF